MRKSLRQFDNSFVVKKGQMVSRKRMVFNEPTQATCPFFIVKPGFNGIIFHVILTAKGKIFRIFNLAPKPIV